MTCRREAAFACAVFLLLALPAFAPAQTAGRSFYFFVLPREFSAVGQWTTTDPKDRNTTPQETQFDCFRQSRMCVEAVSEFYFGHAHVAVSYPTVIRWDRDGIVARDDHGICMTRTLSVNFADKSIIATYFPKTLPDKTKEACRFFGAKGHNELFVVKGSKEWEETHSVFPPK